jgi:palmitoyltransferase ZDHHC9/14/18
MCLPHLIIKSNISSALLNFQIFCLGGRLIFGPDYRSILLTISLITVPVILFAVFICKRLADEVDYFLGNLVLSISVILCVHVSFALS